MIDILFIGPHPDDVESACAGTILGLVEEGVRVGIADLTDGEPTPCGTPEKRAKECRNATKLLGIEYRTNLNMLNRYLMDDTANRKALAAVIREQKPSILVAPYWVCEHPDHVQASLIADGARFYGRLTKCDIPGAPHRIQKTYYYPAYHLKLHIDPSFIVDISSHYKKKLQVLRQYRSQFIDKKDSSVFGTVEAVNRYFGYLIRKNYGEAFISREETGVGSLSRLLV